MIAALTAPYYAVLAFDCYLVVQVFLARHLAQVSLFRSE